MPILQPYGPSQSEQRRTAERFGTPAAGRNLARVLRRAGASWTSPPESDGALRIGRAVACRSYDGYLKGPYTGLATACSLIGFASEAQEGLVAFVLTGNSSLDHKGWFRHVTPVAPEDLRRGTAKQGCPTLVWHGRTIALPRGDEPSATWFLNGWLELLPPGREYISINATVGRRSSDHAAAAGTTSIGH